MCLFFQGSDSYSKRVNNWKLSLAAATPASVLAYNLLGMAQPFVYPMLFLPTLYHLYDLQRIKAKSINQIYKFYLYQNGEQVLLQTYDGMLHRMNITDNEGFQIRELKDNLVFDVENGGRTYTLDNKDCELIDFELLERILKGIQVETHKF